MRGQYIIMNKEQFKIFNQDDQFNLIENMFGDFDDFDFDAEMQKLIDEYNSFYVDRDDNIWGEKDRKLNIIQQKAFDARMIAQEVVDF